MAASDLQSSDLDGRDAGRRLLIPAPRGNRRAELSAAARLGAGLVLPGGRLFHRGTHHGSGPDAPVSARNPPPNDNGYRPHGRHGGIARLDDRAVSPCNEVRGELRRAVSAPPAAAAFPRQKRGHAGTSRQQWLAFQRRDHSGPGPLAKPGSQRWTGPRISAAAGAK